MRALVLCGGIPQVALLKELKKRNIYTILADMNDKVIGKQYADKFYPASVFEIDDIKAIAIEENVDFILTACADQVLLVQAKISEMLNLPCYISYETAQLVSNKREMKKIFVKNNIPTSKYLVLKELDMEFINNLSFPLIVKPVDAYSSRGVNKVENKAELLNAFEIALSISRDKSVIIEEFVEGEELSIDVYVENGKASVLCISYLDKIQNNDGFVINRTRVDNHVSRELRMKINQTAQKIADAFKLTNSPMLIQAITKNDSISVIEFCARTGGGDKFSLIKEVSNFDVIKALVDLTLGHIPHVDKFECKDYVLTEFLYCRHGILNRLEGFSQLKNEGTIFDYKQLKSQGTLCQEIKSSGDRVAYFTIKANSIAELKQKHKDINRFIKILDSNNEDILRHDLMRDLYQYI